VSDTDTEAAQAPTRRRDASRRRGLELAGLVLGIAAGVGVAAVWLIPSLRHLSGPPPVNSPPAVVQGSTMAPDPAGLDAEWAAYSNQSGCADWAGGDGVSAIRLNSSQRLESGGSTGADVSSGFSVIGAGGRYWLIHSATSST
jgi:hypothetical protein